MKKIVLFLFTLLSFSVAYAQPGSLSQSVIRYRVNDSTAAIAANVSAIAAGYAPMFYNNQATTPHWDVWNGGTGGAYDHVFDFNSGSGGGGGGATAAGATGNVQYKSNGGGLQAEAAFSYDSATNLLTVPSVTAGSSTSLTDGAAITITGTKHTLTSDEAAITWTLSQTGDYQTTDIILNAGTTDWTFPANTLIVSEGTATGSNLVTLAGSSGDHYIMSIYKDGTNYRVVIKNFGQ